MVAIVENNNNIDLKIDGKLGMFNRGARVQLREQHIGRNLDILNAVSVGHLDILNFSGLGFLFECFDTDQLDLQRLNIKFGLPLDNIAIEGVLKLAVHRKDLSFESELGDLTGGRRLQVVVRYHKVLRDEFTLRVGFDTAARADRIKILLKRDLFKALFQSYTH